MEKKLLSNLRRLSVCLLLPFIALQARAQASTVANVKDGYYNIITSDSKYVNVAGRKTVNFVSATDAKTKAGTVIRVKTKTNSNGQVEVEILRSQGVDIPGYAERAMNYVPKIVQLVANKLNAVGTGEILGNDGLQAIMDKFNASFDYHLYLESDGSDAYRIYGKTPSMQPVVDFYLENKAKVDAKLPQLEDFINDAIHKLLNKTNGSGASILVDFSLHTVWEKMGGASSGLTEPTDDDDSIAKFYYDVLTDKDNVWNFAYQTAMIYWSNLKKHQKFQEIKDELGDYAQYIDKVENIRPDFKYYIVPGTSTLDIISEGNTKIKDKDLSTAWTLKPCTEFTVNFPEANKRGDKYYTTLYTDFAYKLKGVTAMKVTAVSDAGVAKTEEISGTIIPAQTPVMLVSTAPGDQTLTPTIDAGTAVTDNLLNGPDYLINKYKIKTAQVVTLFNFAKKIFGGSFYDNCIAKYEHLMARNAGTVNNKYFFGLTEADLNLCTYTSGSEKDCVVRSLAVDDNNKLAFSDHWTVAANKAFLVSDEHNVIKLFLKGDINMDGIVNVTDVTTLVDYILERDPSPCDVDACDVTEDRNINVTDVTTLVDIILNQ